MSNPIPDTHKILFEKPILASLATIMPDGKPQVNPVWCDFDGVHVRVNSAAGRQKDKNLKERGLATVLLVDPENGFFWIEVRGRVEEATASDENTDQLALYQNTPNPFDQSTEIRYFLPKTVQKAQLMVYDLNGTQLMAFSDLAKGQGSVEIKGSDLKAGIRHQWEPPRCRWMADRW